MAEAFLTNQNYSLPALINLIYPIGSIYLSVNSTSPQQLFGGEWEQIKDKFLLSAGDTYSSGSEGGEATHTLTNDEMPAHRHTIYMNDVASDGEFWGQITSHRKVRRVLTSQIQLAATSHTTTCRRTSPCMCGKEPHKPTLFNYFIKEK